MTIPSRGQRGRLLTHTIFVEQTNARDLVPLVNQYEAKGWRVVCLVKTNSRKWIVTFV